MRSAGGVATLAAGSLLHQAAAPVMAPSAGRLVADALARRRRPLGVMAVPTPDLAGVRVYAVDDESVQLTWRGSPAGRLLLGAGQATVEVVAPPPAYARLLGRAPRRLGPWEGGPSSAVLTGLEPDTEYEVWAEVAGRGRHTIATARTLRRPPGELLFRLATLNDIHIGERAFGLVRRFEDTFPLPPGEEPYALRCARAAVEEARAWGAEHLVVKGDLTRDSEPSEFRTVGQLLAGSGLPADVVLGNHDDRHGVDAATWLGESGIDARPVTRFRDLPGLRLILAHTPGPGDKWGQILPGDAGRIADLARSAAGAAMLVVHHPPATGPVTLHYPPGIYHGQSRDLLRRLAAANPASVVVAGHTHRNRLRTAQGIPCVETSSTKDHPGQWTGYRVFGGGIVQTARRIASPGAMAWTEASALALGGQWGRWSPGTLGDRSWSLAWPAARRPG